MTDNPWLPIDTMPLSTVGTEVDIQEKRRLYSGVTVAGIRLECDLIEEKYYAAGGSVTTVGSPSEFAIVTTGATINATPYAQWRPHV